MAATPPTAGNAATSSGNTERLRRAAQIVRAATENERGTGVLLVDDLSPKCRYVAGRMFCDKGRWRQRPPGSFPPILSKCNERTVTFRKRRKRRKRATPIALSEEGVDALVGDVFFVVEGADVGGDEGFDAVSEASCGFGEGHAGA